MIISRSPFRITLGGGGTDLPTYYTKYGGFIFAAGLNKYMYISVNKCFDELIRVKYSQSETVEHREDVKHNLAREALKMLAINEGIEIVSIADIPANTGLGSSSCYAVGLLNSLHAYKREYLSLADLAEEACTLEIDILNSPIGKQDQYMAAFGGLTVLEIYKNGKVKVLQANISTSDLYDLNRNLVLFYTQTQRQANDILSEQSARIKEEKKDVVESMHYIKEIGYKILEAAESGNLTDIGLLFDEHWKYKKRLSSKITNQRFDEIYEIAKKNGALGGKITGAGGGGFFCFYVEQNHGNFIDTMTKLGLRHMKYRFDCEGSKIMVNFRDATI